MPFCSLSPCAGLVALRQSFVHRCHLRWSASERPDQHLSCFETRNTRSRKRTVSKLVLVAFPELNQAFDVGERLTLPLPVSFDPVKGVDLIFQLPWRKLSRGYMIKMRILFNASKDLAPLVLTALNLSQLIRAFKYLGEMCEIN